MPQLIRLKDMKKLTLLITFVALSLLACKKQPLDKADKPKLPEDPMESAPVSGTTLGDNPNAEIICREVNAVLGYNQHVSLDVDADGNADFNFFSILIHHNDKPHMYLMVSPKSAKSARVMVRDGEELVINALWTQPLEKDELISETPVDGCIWTDALTKGFITGSSKTAQQESYTGLWAGKSDKFLGIRFKIDGNQHYGWIKLSHDKISDKISLISYAYQKIAGKAIEAGHTGS